MTEKKRDIPAEAPLLDACCMVLSRRQVRGDAGLAAVGLGVERPRILVGGVGNGGARVV